MEAFVDWFNGVWKRSRTWSPTARRTRRARALGRPYAAPATRFEAMLTGREYLSGDFGAADCIVLPFLRYAVHIDPEDDERFHQVLHERMDVSEQPQLAAWISRVGQRPR